MKWKGEEEEDNKEGGRMELGGLRKEMGEERRERKEEGGREEGGKSFSVFINRFIRIL